MAEPEQAGTPADPIGWIRKFLIAVAEARIPPSDMRIVPEQGIINLVTGTFGIALYTAAGYVNASARGLSLASQITMAIIGAALLFTAAMVVIVTARQSNAIVDEWRKTSSVFIVVWLLALAIYLILTYPLLLITNNYIVIDKLAYWINDRIFYEQVSWRDDLTKSLICTFLAGLILIFRTKRADSTFSLNCFWPWLWLLLMTVVAGVVFHISLFQLSRTG